MAREHRKAFRYGGRVDGDLACRPAYEERPRYTEKAGEEVRRAPVQRPESRTKARTAHRVREKQSVSPILLAGFAALAAMVLALVMGYAQLTAISADIVSLQEELDTLQEEHVKLLTDYERTFDLARLKEAAEAAGMTKPSASQIYYVDLSEPDSVVVCEQQTNVLTSLLTSFGHAAGSIVEYFR